jgi:hypothetical protein
MSDAQNPADLSDRAHEPAAPDGGEDVNMDGEGGYKPLRLLAQEAEDLEVISAALQDAIAHVGDIRYEPAARRLTMLLNRFRWEVEEGAPSERVYAAFQLGDVGRVQHRGLTSDDKGALVYCLAMSFEPGEAPGGVILLLFSGGHEMRIEVECIDAVLADVSDPWQAARAPAHAEDVAIVDEA